MTTASSPAPAPAIPGLVFREPLGSGGYADVHLYEQQSPRMLVAVKVLKGEGLTDEVRRQFVREADLMAELGDHPYIVQVFQAATAGDGRPFIVMKYYPPPNLAARARTQQFTVTEVLRTGIQLCSAIETAHRGGVIHRDIKPANVLVSAYGAPGLTDFGIAGRGTGEGELGEAGVSVPWAPPEVLYGHSNGDERGDVYSLAATLWQLLVGRSPFEVPGGDNSAYALMPRIRSTPVPATGRADVPTSLERILSQAMAKDPALRPASAIELARALQGVEQEMRLAPTTIVVLDEQGQTTLVGGNDPTSPYGDGRDGRDQGAGGAGGGGSRRADSEDATRIKTPQRVAAQPRFSPEGVDERTHRPAARSGAFEAAGTTHAVRRDAPTWQEAGATRTRPDAASDDSSPTVARTPRLLPDQPGEPSPAYREASATGRAGAGRPGWLVPVLAAAVVVLVAVVVGVVVLTRGEDQPRVTAPPKVVTTPTDDSAIGDGVFTAPTLTAASSAGAVTFSWTYADAQSSDAFRVQLGATADAAGQATPKVVSKPTLKVATKAGVTVCALVSVVRGGQVSPASAPQCERAT